MAKVMKDLIIQKQENVFFTVTGLNYRVGNTSFIDSAMNRGEVKVRLIKEPDNEYDNEAIKAEMEGLGQIGYVANSVHTKIGESYSAGRIYDLFEDEAEGTVKYVMDQGLLCKLDI